jgi:hypothetical protein
VHGCHHVSWSNAATGVGGQCDVSFHRHRWKNCEFILPITDFLNYKLAKFLDTLHLGYWSIWFWELQGIDQQAKGLFLSGLQVYCLVSTARSKILIAIIFRGETKSHVVNVANMNFINDTTEADGMGRLPTPVRRLSDVLIAHATPRGKVTLQFWKQNLFD